MTSRRDSKETVLAAGILVVLVVVVYAGSVSGGFLNWDDETYLLTNPEMEMPLGEGLVSAATTVWFANYNPLHRVVNLLVWHTSDGSSAAYRVTNLALHALASFLLYLLLAEWLGRRLPAFVAAALFAVHPGNVENVAWISESKTLLCAVLGFGALLAYLKGARGWARGTPIALGLFTVALLAKTSLVALPGLIVLLDLSIRRRPSLPRYALFAVPAVVLGAVQVHAAAVTDSVTHLHGGSPLAHAGTVVAALPRYVQGAFAPFGVAAHHPFEPVRSATDPRLLLGLALLAAAGALTAVSWRRERRLFVAIPWFLAALLPMLVVPIPIIYAERYLYVAIPFLLAAGASFAVRGRGFRRGAGVAVLAAFGLWFAVSSALYARTWRTSTTVWARVAQVHPDHGKGWGMLAWSRLSAGDAAGASRAFERYARINPDDRRARIDHAVAEYRAGRPARAVEILENLVAEAPDAVDAWTRLAKIHELRKDEAGERDALRRAAAALPERADLWRSLGARLDRD